MSLWIYEHKYIRCVVEEQSNNSLSKLLHITNCEKLSELLIFKIKSQLNSLKLFAYQQVLIVIFMTLQK